jgi:hypothetical protein
MATPLRWGKGPSVTGLWHVVVEDRPASESWPWGRQRAACGTQFVQAEEWLDMAPRYYLRDNACPRCMARHPMPDEPAGQSNC